ncbi:hypothetical protein [Edaphobacter albus]|uniref:hypothetical protein n=1 Tax=Edaphobacter sp. 4G125 TaxID=2763071 RepID=UPI001647E49E|nr:hypothetical protein [Edaphobacter sp. 4G125]QNI38088.1 hypothetical protein H7846_07515 [Edaphobacter sp. 4G125]
MVVNRGMVRTLEFEVEIFFSSVKDNENKPFDGEGNPGFGWGGGFETAGHFKHLLL